MGHFRTTPNYDQPLIIKDSISTSWWRWMQDIDTRVPPSSEVAVKPVASPFIYSAPIGGNLVISGGTVSSIQVARTSGVFYTTGQTAGMFNLCANDQIKVTYSSPPTMTFLPT